ncbi:V-type ATP synthase subunit D [Candidatus Peregrinibacteria bacterium]|nr:MAG: V-type ATP synthase subunit D [Candidatus Peregrinibacteria bacterium]
MAILDVNPTRMSLLLLRKQLTTANRGHKLLKDKRDGLMKHFMEIIRKTRELRLFIEAELGTTLSRFLSASSTMNPRIVEGSLLFPEAQIELEVTTRNVMSVYIPSFSAESSGSLINYGYAQTTGDLDIGLQKLQKLLPKLLELAEFEKGAENLADEIEKVRRRVNALEYNMIPNYKETIKFIIMKLGEQERSTIIATMVLKNQMLKKEA